jgi:hypothetical protein
MFVEVEDVDRELVVELAVGDAVGGRGDPLRDFTVEQFELGVDPRRGALDPAQPAHDGDGDRLTGDREVADRLGGLAPPQLLVLLEAHVVLSISLGSSRLEETPFSYNET